MKLFISSILLLLIVIVIPATACTTFVLKTKTDLVFGRNLDWVSEHGLIVTNARGVYKESLVFMEDTPLKWTSKYGSITFNQFGKEFPFGGMNEKGLVIEIMLASASYPAIDHRPAVNELQWIQYQLDNSATIEEVIAKAKKIRISMIAQQLHYLICDANGNTAVIEFRAGRMKVYSGSKLPYPVLENSVYQESLRQKRNNEECRFATASSMVSNYEEKEGESILDYSFKILKEVALDGAWSIVYDIKNMKVYFKTASNQKVSCFDVNRFSFECSVDSKMYELQNHSEGDLTSFFEVFSSRENKKIFKDALKTNEIPLPLPIKKQFMEYHKNCICKED